MSFLSPYGFTLMIDIEPCKKPRGSQYLPSRGKVWSITKVSWPVYPDQMLEKLI